MNNAYIFQSSLILYFFKAAGKTFQHGSSNVTLNDLAALLAASFALDRSRSLVSVLVPAFVALCEDEPPTKVDAAWGPIDPFDAWVGAVGVGPDGGVAADAPRMDDPDICRAKVGGCSGPPPGWLLAGVPDRSPTRGFEGESML